MYQQRFQLSQEIWDYEKCHILYHDKFVFCLLCKRDIGPNPDPMLHVTEFGHQENKKSLLKSCIWDPFCDSIDLRYADIVYNSKIDISQLLSKSNKQSYICQIDDALVCLVCQKLVSKTSDVLQAINELQSHLNSKRGVHLRNLNDVISWVYYMNKNNAFIKFYKSTVYCSVCDENLDYVDDMMIHAAVGHLQSNQHKSKLQYACIIGDPGFVVTKQTSDEESSDNRPAASKPEDKIPSQFKTVCIEVKKPLEQKRFTCDGDSIIKISNYGFDIAIHLHSKEQNKDYPVVKAGSRDAGCKKALNDSGNNHSAVNQLQEKTHVQVSDAHLHSKEQNKNSRDVKADSKYAGCKKALNGSGNKNSVANRLLEKTHVQVSDIATHLHSKEQNKTSPDVQADSKNAGCKKTLNDSGNKNSVVNQLQEKTHVQVSDIATHLHSKEQNKKSPDVKADSKNAGCKKSLVQVSNTVDSSNGTLDSSKNSFIDHLMELEVYRMYFNIENRNLLCKLCRCILHFDGDDLASVSETFNSHILHHVGKQTTAAQRLISDAAVSGQPVLRSTVSKQTQTQCTDPDRFEPPWKSSCSDKPKQLVEDPLYAEHVGFMKGAGGIFTCQLCNVPVPNLSGGNSIREHILGSKHRKKFKQNKNSITN